MKERSYAQGILRNWRIIEAYGVLVDALRSCKGNPP